MRDVSTFLYDGITDETANPSTARMLLFHGGAATGKTTVLRHLFEKQGGPGAVFIEGTHAEAVGLLKRADAENQSVFIDDLDKCFSDDVRDLLDHLVRVSGSMRVRATSTYPPDLAYLRGRGAFTGVKWPEDQVKSWSDILMDFTARPVDPWSLGWKRRVFDLVTRAAPEGDDAGGWTTAVLHLTGAQPAMLEAALQYLGTLEKQPPPSSGSVPAVSDEEWQRRTDSMEQHLFATGFKRLRRAVGDVEKADPRAAAYLVRIARDEPLDAEEAKDDALRRSLTASGLAYRATNRPYAVAGDILRRFLAEEGTTRYPSVRTEGDAERGDLIVALGAETIVVPLRGKNWQLARALGREPGAKIAAGDLAAQASIGEPALRSAIQRLKTEIERAGFDNIVENVWNEGYRFNTYPWISEIAPRDL